MGASVSTAVQVGSVRSCTELSWSKGKKDISAAITCGDITFDVTAEGITKTVSLQLESSHTKISFSTDSIQVAAAGQTALKQCCNSMQLKENEVVLKEVLQTEFPADKLASLPVQHAVAVTKLVEEPWSAVPGFVGVESRLVMLLQLQVAVCKGSKARGVSEGVVQTSLKLSGTLQPFVEVRNSNKPLTGATSSAQADVVQDRDQENFIVALSQAVFPMAGAALSQLLGKKQGL